MVDAIDAAADNVDDDVDDDVEGTDTPTLFNTARGITTLPTRTLPAEQRAGPEPTPTEATEPPAAAILEGLVVVVAVVVAADADDVLAAAEEFHCGWLKEHSTYSVELQIINNNNNNCLTMTTI